MFSYKLSGGHRRQSSESPLRSRLVLASLLLLLFSGVAAQAESVAQVSSVELVVLFTNGAPPLADAAKPGSKTAPGKKLFRYDFSDKTAASGKMPVGLNAAFARLAQRHNLLGVERLYEESSPKRGGLKGRRISTASGMQTLEQPTLDRIVFSPGTNLDQCIAELKALPGVALVERNQTGELCYVPSDPLYSQTAADLSLISVQSAWDIQPGADASVTVAVIDSGVEPTHPDLAGVLDLANSYNFVAGNTDIVDDLGHGTRVAGIIGASANDGQGIAGIGFGCRIMSLDVTTSSGVINSANVAAAILWARDHGARIINLSLRFQAPSEILKLACDSARDAGCLLVAAAGNENQSQNPVYPASYDSVLAVGALMDDGVTRAPWSNYNAVSGVKLADLVAPGSTVFSCIPGGQYNGTYGSGTSFAAPMASGVAALLAARNPLQTGLAIGQQLKATADSLGAWAGAGRLNARTALQNPLVPSFAIQSVRVDDAVAYGGANDADGFMEPGETVKIYVTLKNNGADADNVQATLSETNPDATLTDTTGVWGAIRSIATVENSLNGFDGISLAAGAAAQDAPFHLAVVANGGGFTQGLDFTVPTERNLVPPAYIDVNTTWTRNNTYSLVRNTVVNPGAKLVIQAGTKIRCNGNGGLEVQGALDVQGDAANKVVMTSIDGTAPVYTFDPAIEFCTMANVDRGSSIIGVDDINSDGMPDFAVSKGVGYSSQSNYFYTYWSSRGYNYGSLLNSEGRWDGYPIVFGDLDADGRKEGIGTDGSNGLIVRTFIYPFTLFKSSTIAIAGYSATNITDIDNDGDNDIIAASGSSIYVLRNPGNGTFTGSFMATGAPKSIKPAIGDTDGDGLQEIWSNRVSPPAFFKAKWNGASFTGTYYNLPAAVGPQSIVDLDEDGRKEVAAYSPSKGCLYSIEWNGTGYDTPTTITLAIQPALDTDVQLLDLDKDGKTDILEYDRNALKFWMQRGLAGYAFDPPVLLRALPFAPLEWTIGDLSNDGMPDLVTHYTNPLNTADRISALYSMDIDSKTLHKGLWIRSTAAASSIRNMIVQYGPVKDDATNTTWQDCLFERNYPYDLNAQANYAFISTAGSIPITRCTVKGNRDGGGINAGTKQLIDCVAQDNWGVGLLGGTLQGCQGIHNFSYGLQASAGVTSGTATRNADWGIKTTGAVVGSTVTDNVNGIDAGSATNCVARANQQIGIKSGGAVAGCRAEANGAAGLQGSGSFTDCVVYGNGTGLSLTGTATRCYIAENIGDGIDGGTVVDSVVAGNKGQGIDTASGISGSYIVGNQSHGVLNVANTGQMHGCYLERNASGFDYRDTRLSTVLPVVNLTGNYWGATITPIMNAHPWGSNFNIATIRDFWDDFTLTEANYGGHLTAPPASTNAPACLLSVTPNPASATGVGPTTFTLIYNRPMNTSINPAVTFGQASPYASCVVERSPGWVNSTTWRGIYAIQSDTLNGTQTLRITGPRAANGFVVPDDTSHPFRVDTSGGGSANNGVASGLGTNRMSLSWSEVGRSPTALGYNVLRSMSGVPGSFQRVNPSYITSPNFTDSGLGSGQVYFYIVDLVEANANSTQWTPPFYGVTEGGSLPLVNFAAWSSTANENGGTVHLSLNLSQSSLVPVTVQYSVGGTATAGSDYQPLAGSVTFNPGQTDRQIDLAILDDSAIELDETVIVTLTSASNASLGDRATHTLTIIDNDFPAVSFQAPTATVSESAGTVNCVLVLSEPVSKAVTVQYSVGGNATGSGVDFDTLPGSVTFLPGETQKMIPIHIIDDAVVELDETIVLTLTGAVNANPLGMTQYTLAIQDNDPPQVRFAAATSTLAEAGGTAHITVTLSARTNRIVTAQYTLGGSAQGGGIDYISPSGTVTFNPTENSKTIDIPIINDGQIEPDETVSLSLTGATNGLVGSPALHTLTIVDDDLPAVNFANFFSTVNEDTGWTTLTMQLSHVAYHDVNVYYSGSGTAQGGGVDYDTPAGLVTFKPLETSKRIPIHIINDALIEGDEDIVFSITNASNASVGSPYQHTMMIYDDDQPTSLPIVNFSRDNSTAAENQGSANVRLNLTRQPGDPGTREVRVYYTVGGSAAAGTDYAPLPGMVALDAGQTSKSISIALIDDDRVEPDKTIQFTLISAENARLGGVLTHTVSIVDNDKPTAGFASSFTAVDESVGTATLELRLSDPISRPVEVQYSITGTAQGGGVDYISPPGTVMFQPFETSKQIQIAIVDDSAVEGGETVILTLSSLTNALFGAVTQHTVVIRDNDQQTLLPVVNFARNSSSLIENQGNASIQLVLTRQPGDPGTQAVTVYYATAGTATSGADYVPPSGQVVFEAGDTTKTITLALIDDNRVELDETVQLTLTGADNAILGGAILHNLTIVDDDLPQVNFAATYSEVDEAISTTTLMLTLSDPISRPVQVHYTVGGTAGNLDFDPLPGIMTFASLETTRQLAIHIKDDTVVEGDETIVLTLSALSNAKSGPLNQHLLLIHDNDSNTSLPIVNFVTDHSTMAENGGTANIPLSLTRQPGAPTNRTVAVQYSIGGTATIGGDFIPLTGGFVVFEADETTQTIPIALIDDTLPEPAETVQLTLTGVYNAILGGVNQHTLTITDDDRVRSLARQTWTLYR